MNNVEFLIEGHRGTRGLMPENTIPGMIKAIQDGADVLEMDLQFTADGSVVVAHDPFINRAYTLDRYGNEIPKSRARKNIIYRMNYCDVRQFDVGSKKYNKYPQQEKLKTYIPKLEELINYVEQFTKENQLKPISYNIEIKAGPDGDNVLHPPPAALIKKVVNILKAANIESRYRIQSFDRRQIQEVKKSYPEITVAFLTADKNKTVTEHLIPLGFLPAVFSPYYRIVTIPMVEQAHSLGIKIIPWTVNDKKSMKALIKKGVDGIITDYPGILKQLRDS